MIINFILILLFILNFQILNKKFKFNNNINFNILLFFSNFFILLILLVISTLNTIGIETLFYLRDKFINTNYSWQTDIDRSLIFILLSLFFYNISYFFFAKGFSKLKVYQIPNTKLKDKYLFFFIILFLILFYLKFLNLDVDLIFTYKKILNNHISNLFFSIIFIIIVRDLLLKEKFLLFLAFSSLSILLVGYLTQSRISIIIFIVFLFYGLKKLSNVKELYFKFNYFLITIFFIVILSVFLWIYFIGSIRANLNFDDSIRYQATGIYQSFLGIFLRFEFIYQLENLFQNYQNYFFFNDFNFFIHQIIPNFIDKNNLEYRDFLYFDVDRSIYGDYVYTNLGQIVTTTTTYNPILDSYARFGWHSYLYFIIFSLCICSFIFFYSLEKTNVFILINFYNLIIFDKSLYYIIQQNLYYVFILLLITLFYYVYKRFLT
tara:strand:- start:1137 stop:2438 length:1302 start_codon:yes stop_codon:yes gene_type:complete